LFFAKIKSNHPTAIIGNANAEIENLSNPSNATIRDEAVVPILAPMMMPIALLRCKTPAQTNPKRIRETKLLLCKSEVASVPVRIDFQVLPV